MLYFLLIDYVTFVVHTPSSVDELQAALLHQLAHSVLHAVGLLAPPTPKEAHFNIDKSAIRVHCSVRKSAS